MDKNISEQTKNPTSYKDAGVDIDKGNQLVDAIKPIAKATSRTGANVDLGSFGGLFDLAACKFKDPVLVAANDGVGTKLKIAFDTDIHNTIGVDLVAMCVNDLVVQGAEPLFFLDYFATGGLDNNVATQVIASIADGCRDAGCALIGGETAEMPGIYQKSHYDLAGFAVGAVERDQVLPRVNMIKPGDVVLGLASSGVHSNGYSLVRHLLAKNNISYSQKLPYHAGKTYGAELLTPTKIYVKSCLAAARTSKVKAFAHITGGGFLENIPRVLPKHVGVMINKGSWNVLPIFNLLQELGAITDHEMYKTFNCGIGMVVVVSSRDVASVTEILKEQGETVYQIGAITEYHGGERVIVN